jgi:NAD(P)-dependent dehydrogenase (short-subunit alcohol dehydrogenase family)
MQRRSGWLCSASVISLCGDEDESTMSAPLFLITGGSRGIGAATALSAARAGYQVLLTYLQNQGAAEAVVARIREQGGQAQALQADTSNEADVARAFAVADRIGPVKALVYNGGITGTPSTLADAETATLRRVLDVNVLGAMICAREAVRRMSTRSGGAGGSIVFISSRASLHGSAGEYVWYAASKGAIDSLVIGLAREVATQGIRANVVSPGVINTEIHVPGRLERMSKFLPMERPGEPDEVAAAVMFCVSDAASYVTGANIAVGGGR